MKRISLLLRWAVVCGLVAAVFILELAVSPVRAGVACVNTIPITDGTDDNIGFELKLVGKSLVWFKTTGELFLYHLETAETRQIGMMQVSKKGNDQHFAVDKDYIVWIDPAFHIQLYHIVSGTTTQLTDNARLRVELNIEGNYVLWREGKTKEKRNKLIAYDIANGTMTRITKTDSYSLNKGRVLWNGNLYNLADDTTTFLGESYYTQLNGNYALGLSGAETVSDRWTWPPPPVLQFAIKNLETGSVKLIYKSEYIEYFTLGGDYIAWASSDYIGLTHFSIYQISTGIERQIGYWDHWGVFRKQVELTIDGRFIGFANSDDYGTVFSIYDGVFGLVSEVRYDANAYSALGAIDNRRIAWVDYKLNYDDEVYDTQVILKTDCGAAPTIIDQTPSKNILTGRSVTLSISTVGDLLTSYQWYQGEVTNTTHPVGINSPEFETPPLLETTSYWVRVSNYFGTADSTPIIVTVDDQVELVLDGGFEQTMQVGWKLRYMYRTCSDSDPSSPVYSGECALVIESYGKSKAVQELISIPYMTGDMLTLSAWIKAKKLITGRARLLLEVSYVDGTKAKVVIKPSPQQFDYTLFSSEPLVVEGEIDKVRTLIKYNSMKGQWWVDEVSVVHQADAENAILPLPAD